MNLPALPIVQRELMTAARSPVTHRSRMIIGTLVLLASVVGVWLLGAAGGTGAGTAGKDFFMYAAWGAWFYCLMAGFGLTLHCIADERQQGTLGLLFLTHLRGSELIFGKLFARSLRSLDGLLAAMPVFAVSLLLGGVLPMEYARVGLALVNTLFCSVAVGIYLSSQRLETASRSFLGIMAILFWGLVLPFTAAVLKSAYRDFEALAELLANLTPLSALAHAPLDATGKFTPVFWQALMASHLLGHILVLLAARSTSRTWQDRPNEVKKLRRRREWLNWDFRSAGRDPAYRTRLLNRNPLHWLTSRERNRPLGYWLYLLVVYGGLGLCWLLLLGRDAPLGMWWLAAVTFDFGLKLKLNATAGIRFLEERRSNSFELLLSTQQNIHDILRGFRLSLFRQFGGPVLTATAVNLLMLCTLPLWKYYSKRIDDGIIILVTLVYLAASLFNHFTLMWVGFWKGLAAKPDANPNFGFLQVIVRPWLGLAILAFCGTTFFDAWWRHRPDSFFIIVAAFLVLISDALYLHRARRSFFHAFRKVTSEPDLAPLPVPGRWIMKLITLGAYRSSGARGILEHRRWWQGAGPRWAALALMLVGTLMVYHLLLQRKLDHRIAGMEATGIPSQPGHLTRFLQPMDKSATRQYEKAFSALSPIPQNVWIAGNREDQAKLREQSRIETELIEEAGANITATSIPVIWSYVLTNRIHLETVYPLVAKPGFRWGLSPPINPAAANPAISTISASYQLRRYALLIDLHTAPPRQAFASMTNHLNFAKSLSREPDYIAFLLAAKNAALPNQALPALLARHPLSADQLEALRRQRTELQNNLQDQAQMVIHSFFAIREEMFQNSSDQFRKRYLRMLFTENTQEAVVFGIQVTGGKRVKDELLLADLAEAGIDFIATGQTTGLELLRDQAATLQEGFAAQPTRTILRVLERQATTRIQLHLLEAVIAIERHRLKHGRLPRSLSRLSPEYLNDPRNEFDKSHPLNMVLEEGGGYAVTVEVMDGPKPWFYTLYPERLSIRIPARPTPPGNSP